MYCDTRLIIQALEARSFPFPALPPLHTTFSSPADAATSALLESWTIDGGIFQRAAQILPPDLALMKDPKFQRDREDFMGGRKWDPETVKGLRPEGQVHLRHAFDFLETGHLADGRSWILATEGPSLADIHGVWPFHWLVLGMKTAMPDDIVSAKTHPKVWAWIERFDASMRAEAGKVPRVKRMKGPEAVECVLGAEYAEGMNGERMEVDGTDPVGKGLRKGQLVKSWPSDTGSRHQDTGRLLKLDKEEVVLEVEGKEGKMVRLHHPRWNFRIRSIGNGAKL